MDVRFRFDAIVFDFDGVLVESVDIKTQAFVELYRSYGDAVVNEVTAFHLAHGGMSRYEKFRYFHSALLGRVLSDENERQLAARFSSLVEDAVVAAPWVAGALEFLESQHAQLPLFVASGTPDAELRRIVRRRGAQFYFREIEGAPQPKGAILHRFINLGGHTPERVLMVGDSLTDFEGAQEAGTLFLGRVAKGVQNPFPASVKTIEDIETLAACLLV